MKKINKFLLIAFSIILAISGYLASKAQDIRVEKEETIYKLIARINILNTYYNIGKYKEEKHSLENYEEMLKDHTSQLTIKIKGFNPRIKKFNNWSIALLIISILGNTVILVIETINESSINRLKPNKSIHQTF